MNCNKRVKHNIFSKDIEKCKTCDSQSNFQSREQLCFIKICHTFIRILATKFYLEYIKYIGFN